LSKPFLKALQEFNGLKYSSFCHFRPIGSGKVGRVGNKPSPYVLRALCILGPEEILKLAHVLHREEVSFKKAAGDDFVFWKEGKPSPKKEESRPKTEAKVLHFSRPTPQVEEKADSPEETETQDGGQIMSSEIILMQREISRESASGTQKASAKSGYQKATEMYVVKSNIDGKEKIRFASTNGVLINKKQA
jgi:hypothetical protein